MLVKSTYTCVVASRGLESTVVDMGQVEDFDSRPHKPVVFKVMLENVLNK